MTSLIHSTAQFEQFSSNTVQQSNEGQLRKIVQSIFTGRSSLNGQINVKQ